MSTEGNILVKELNDYTNKISETNIQLEILNSIENFISENKDSFDSVPTNSQLTNRTLAELITEFYKSDVPLLESVPVCRAPVFPACPSRRGRDIGR